MAIGINDLDDDDYGMGFSPSTQEEPQTEPVINQPVQTDDDNFMSDFLKTKGIDDISKINFENENGEIVSRNWNDLTKEEKFNILNTPLESPTQINTYENDLSEEEISFLNQLRQNNMTPNQYIEQISKGEVINEPQYSVDQLSDDEIYLLDLESRVGELTDDQAIQALNIVKQQGEELYKKQIEGIRKEYKEREDLKNQQAQAQLEEEQQEAFEKYKDSIVNAIDNFTSIGNLDLNFEDSDKETLAEFMLSQDEAGKNYLYEALQDPEILTKAAWFILNGEEALNNVTDYFTNQIKLVSENQYKKGLEDGKKGVVSKPTVVIKDNKINQHRQYSSIEDLDDDE